MLDGLFGRANVKVVELRVREATSVRRNSARLVCSVCGMPMLAHARISRCAFCAGAMRRRTLDDPRVIRVRLKEYRDRTYPIFRKMRGLRRTVQRVDGEPPPFAVHRAIARYLGRSR